MGQSSWREFEALVRDIYAILIEADTGNATVQLGEFIEGPDGPRQCDITIRHRLAGTEFLTVVECRDHKSRLDIKAIDGFASKLNDVSANKGIIVCRNGFSKNAVRKAKRLGIDLRVAGNTQSLRSALIPAVPIVVRVVYLVSVFIAERPGCSPSPSYIFDDSFSVSGIAAMHILIESMRSGGAKDAESWQDPNIPSELKRGVLIYLDEFFAPMGIRPTVRTKEKSHHVLTDGVMVLQVNEEFYFGHSLDLPSAMHLLDISESSVNVVFNIDDFRRLDADIEKFSSFSQVPAYGRNTGITITVVDVGIRPGGKVSAYINNEKRYEKNL